MPEKTLADYAAAFRKLRDKIKELEDAHDGAMRPYYVTQERLRAKLLEHLNAEGQDSAKFRGVGTVYKEVDTSVTISDAEQFRNFVIRNEAWHLADWRASKTRVREYLQEFDRLPPGVNYSTAYKIGFRADNSPKAE